MQNSQATSRRSSTYSAKLLGLWDKSWLSWLSITTSSPRWHLAIAILILLVGCDYTPRTIRMQDHPVVVEKTLIAIEELNAIAECDLFSGGVAIAPDDSKVWRGLFPGRDIITIEIDANAIHGNRLGEQHDRARGARIYIRDEHQESVVYGHELLHALGLGHQDVEHSLMNEHIGYWGAVDDELRAQIRGLCL